MTNFCIAKTWSWHPISSNPYFLLLIDRILFKTYQEL